LRAIEATNVRVLRGRFLILGNASPALVMGGSWRLPP
jgi:hypothetical protein